MRLTFLFLYCSFNTVHVADACTWQDVPDQYVKFGIKSHFVGKLVARENWFNEDGKQVGIKGRLESVFAIEGEWNNKDWLYFNSFVFSGELLINRYYIIYTDKNNKYVDPCRYNLSLKSFDSIESDDFEEYKSLIIELRGQAKAAAERLLLESVKKQGEKHEH